MRLKSKLILGRIKSDLRWLQFLKMFRCVTCRPSHRSELPKVATNGKKIETKIKIKHKTTNRFVRSLDAQGWKSGGRGAGGQGFLENLKGDTPFWVLICIFINNFFENLPSGFSFIPPYPLLLWAFMVRSFASFVSIEIKAWNCFNKRLRRIINWNVQTCSLLLNSFI